MGYSITVLMYEIIVNMKCPNDQSNLVKKTQENVYAHYCQKCHGVFLNPSAVTAFKYNFETDCLDKVFDNEEMHESERKCAQCNQSLCKVDMDSMTIEICKNCKSAFFKVGQLTKIKNKYIVMSDTEGALLGCLPPSLVAIFSLFKYFSSESNPKARKFYGWFFVLAVFFSFFFWYELSQI